MFGSHHDDSDDKKDNEKQEPTAPLPTVFGSEPSNPVPATAPSAIPAGFNPPTQNSALDDLAKDSDQSEPSEPSDDGTSPPDEPQKNADHDELLDIKQDALQKLSPLVGHLDQSPEEKFKTTMMMIQASDDKSKVKEAYEAAQQISDEKERAQALLDVVNEINYFTHKDKED